MSSDQLLTHDISFFVDQVQKIPLLTRAEEFDLATRTRAGDKEAKEKLVVANLRLVIYVAKRYAKKGPDIMELIQEGVFGLIRAAEKFDPNRDIKFATYAHYWVSVFIAKYLNKNMGLLYIPLYAVQRLNKYCKLYNLHSGDVCTDEEIHEFALEELGAAELEKSEELYKITQTYVSLNDTIRGNEYAYEEVILEEQREFSYEEEIEVKHDVHTAMKDALTEEENLVLELKYGIIDGSPYTIDESINFMNNLYKPMMEQCDVGISSTKLYTKEKIKKLEKGALEKLKVYFADPRHEYVR